MPSVPGVNPFLDSFIDFMTAGMAHLQEDATAPTLAPSVKLQAELYHELIAPQMDTDVISSITSWLERSGVARVGC